MNNKPTKSGVILEPVVSTDYLFGVSAIDNVEKVSDGDWTPYLPKSEKQRQGFESMCCTNFSSTSAIEILLTRIIDEKLISTGNLIWLQDNGYIDDSGHINFSDRFDALISNTTPGSGNSLKAVAEAKHKKGLIPEKLLPWTDNETEYFDKLKITPQMTSLGLEFLKRFPVNYEMVYRKDFVEGLKVSPLAGAVFAWNGIVNGIYQTTTQQINHAIAIIKPPYNWQIFDSYDPYLKKLADDYNYYSYAIRYIVREVLVDDANDMKERIIINKEQYLKKNEKEIAHIPDESTLNLLIDWGWTSDVAPTEVDTLAGFTLLPELPSPIVMTQIKNILPVLNDALQTDTEAVAKQGWWERLGILVKFWGFLKSIGK